MNTTGAQILAENTTDTRCHLCVEKMSNQCCNANIDVVVIEL